MSEEILRIALDELKTIRVKRGEITSEFTLENLLLYTRAELRSGGDNDNNLKVRLEALGNAIKSLLELSAEVEFVIPCKPE